MRLGSRCVAILGSQGVIGQLLQELLAADDNVSRVVLGDPDKVTGIPRKFRWRPVDLATDDAVGQIADMIDKDDIDTLVYTGYCSDRPETQEGQARETARIVSALGRRQVPHVVFTSSTVVYGAEPGDPNHLNEDTPLVNDPNSEWVRDKVAAENVVRELELEFDGSITTLRFAVPLGPTVQNFMTDYLRRKAVPVVAGQDPSVQFIHERDVAAAYAHAIANDHDGPFNVVGDGALPLSVALRMGRRRSAPVPELGSYPLHHALWEPDIIEAPAVLQDLFKYIWVADGTRANQVMKFNPRHSTKETVEDFYRPKAKKE